MGAAGEERAAAWYEERGYRVVDRNWRCAEGEIDLVVQGPGVIVFCEVKARSTDRFGAPAEAVTWAKQRRLRRLATRYLQEARPGTPEVRFDVACILAGRLEVIEHAF